MDLFLSKTNKEMEKDYVLLGWYLRGMKSNSPSQNGTVWEDSKFSQEHVFHSLGV